VHVRADNFVCTPQNTTTAELQKMTKVCQEQKSTGALQAREAAQEAVRGAQVQVDAWKERAAVAEAASNAANASLALLQEQFSGLQHRALEQQQHMREAGSRSVLEHAAENARLKASNAALTEEVQLMTTLYDEQQVCDGRLARVPPPPLGADGLVPPGEVGGII